MSLNCCIPFRQLLSFSFVSMLFLLSCETLCSSFGLFSVILSREVLSSCISIFGGTSSVCVLFQLSGFSHQCRAKFFALGYSGVDLKLSSLFLLFLIRPSLLI